MAAEKKNMSSRLLIMGLDLINFDNEARKLYRIIKRGRALADNLSLQSTEEWSFGRLKRIQNFLILDNRAQIKSHNHWDVTMN